MLARQVDRAVLKPELDAFGREVGVGDHLLEDGMTIAVLAGELGAAVGIDRQLPDLEFLARDLFLEALRERDLVEEPPSATGIGDVFGAVGKEDVAHQTVAVPMLVA